MVQTILLQEGFTWSKTSHLGLDKNKVCTGMFMLQLYDEFQSLSGCYSPEVTVFFSRQSNKKVRKREIFSGTRRTGRFLAVDVPAEEVMFHQHVLHSFFKRFLLLLLLLVR